MSYVEIGEPYHFRHQGQTPGLDPDRRNYGSFASFNDPDGNGWLVQEVSVEEQARLLEVMTCTGPGAMA